MITYKPKDWFLLIFKFHSSDTFRILLPTMAVLGAITFGFVRLELHEHITLKSATVFHQILGFALSMLLVFRINTAYDRWWEGRKLWGSLVNNSRSLMSKLTALLASRAPKEVSELHAILATFPFALKEHLRGEVRMDSIPNLPPLDRAGLLSAPNKPVYLYNLLVSRLEALRASGTLTDEQLLFVNPEVFSLIDITGACERIKNSPIPVSYSLFLKKIIFAYTITMPITFSFEYKYWGIPGVMLIFYAFASLELVSEDVEEPFGLDANDLPTDQLAEKIKGDLDTITLTARKQSPGLESVA